MFGFRLSSAPRIEFCLGVARLPADGGAIDSLARGPAGDGTSPQGRAAADLTTEADRPHAER
jgi:hypothetical protein